MENNIKRIYVCETGIGKLRSNLFRDHIKKLGGISVDIFQPEVTHIVVDEKFDCIKLCLTLKLPNCSSLKNKIIISTKWLSSSIDYGKFCETDNYHILCNHSTDECFNTCKNNYLIPSTSKCQTVSSNEEYTFLENDHINTAKKPKYVGLHKNDNDSSYESDVTDLLDSEKTEESSLNKNLKANIPMKRKWICQFSSRSIKFNHNMHITDKLEELMSVYQSINDKWRALGYQKAILALKKYPSEIKSYEEAKSLSGVGERLAEKICEIIEIGKLRKLDEIASQEEIQSLKLFTNVWGAGSNSAQNWVKQGFRTLDDLKTKANLTKHQKIGVLLYNDLVERMPRLEVEKIYEIVNENALFLQPGLIIETCGSFRRGKIDCGDVDILISHPDGKSHQNIFLSLIDRMHKIGFLTHDLVVSSEGKQQKYLGICKLYEENSKHRRLDIIVVPYNEYAAALVYFTGSGFFNRSMRHLASQMKMSLNEHGLFADVSRINGEKVNRGHLISTPTEESIFKILNVPYRPPNERDF